MQLVETYEELIERDARDISVLWKSLQILFYMVNAAAGYIASYAFYSFVVYAIISERSDTFKDQCILWAKPILTSSKIIFPTGNETESTKEQTWQERLQIGFGNDSHCSAIKMISLLSCIGGIVGMTFFAICGRGGHQNRIYPAPWRLVVPAIIFNICLTLLSLQTAANFENGFKEFQYNLNTLLNRTGNDAMLEYLRWRKKGSDLTLWKYFQITKISCWAGVVAWTMGLSLLILRVVNVTDFRLLKVSIYTPKRVSQESEGVVANN